MGLSVNIRQWSTLVPEADCLPRIRSRSSLLTFRDVIEEHPGIWKQLPGSVVHLAVSIRDGG